MNNNSSVSFLGLAVLVLFVLKVMNLIDWSWWWVTAPIWAPIALYVVIALVCLFIGVFVGIWQFATKHQ